MDIKARIMSHLMGWRDKSRRLLWRNEAYDVSEWKNLNRNAFPILAFCTMLLIGNLLFYYLSPYGKVVKYNFVQDLPGAENFTALTQNEDKLAIGGVILKNKTTRFELPKPKQLKKIKVGIAFKPGQREIKLGIRGREDEPYIYQSLFFDPLNDLSFDRLEQDGLILYQKNKQFESIASFLAQLPADKKIGTYQVETKMVAPLVYANNPKGKTEIVTPIRGNASIYTLVTEGELKIGISKQDMNMYDGADALSIKVSMDKVTVSETSIPDDGFVDKSKNQTAPQTTIINLGKTKPGVYKIELTSDSANSDLVIQKIEINQSKVVIEDAILMWQSVPTTVYTDGDKITASTSWAESIQNLKVDDKADLAIKDIKNKFNFDLKKTMKGKPEGELYKLYIPKGNINLSSEGYLAFSPEAMFDPQLRQLQSLSTSMSQAEIAKNYDFVLTTVQPAKEEDYWLVAELNLPASEYSLSSDKIYFSLEIPEIDKQGGSLELGGLNITLDSL